MEEKIICPICGSDNKKIFFIKNKHRIYKCKNCDVNFVWPIPDDLDEIYLDDYYHNSKKGLDNSSFGYTDYDEDKEPMKIIFVRYLKKLENMTTGRNILDIGAATGFFLKIAKKREWKTSGTEVSEYARHKLKEGGHNVYLKNLEDCNFSSFDVVTMWDVLEHLDDPIDFLKRIKNIIKTQSYLVINTIDKSSLWARILGKHWPAIVPPEHLYYFSKEALADNLKKLNFEIVEIKKVGKNFSLPYIFKTLYHWQGLRFWKKLSEYFDGPFWRKIYIPINLRDNIFIIAKKND